MAAKYYAIRQINGEPVREILRSWDECKAKVSGVRSEYKSFKTEEEALQYIGAYEEEEKEEDVLMNKDNHVYYVDGSYMNDRIGWGIAYIKDGNIVTTMCGGIEPTDKLVGRNITGELEASKMAIRHAISNGIKEIYMVHDYQGISSYITGAWTPKEVESVEYTNWVKEVEKHIKINFVKVKGHSNSKFNNRVDELAKLGTTL